MDSTYLRYAQAHIMTPFQYADDLYARSSKVEDANDESTLNNISMEYVEPSIFHSLQEDWASNPQSDHTYIVFKVQPLLATKKESSKPTHTENPKATAKHFAGRIWHFKMANVVDAGFTTSPSRSSRHS